jgi:murein DD-endopeptidase MepM/ murein hydrolase activator NlpD
MTKILFIFIIILLSSTNIQSYYKEDDAKTEEHTEWDVDTQSVLGEQTKPIICSFKYSKTNSKSVNCAMPKITVSKEREYISNGKYNVVLKGTLTRELFLSIYGYGLKTYIVKVKPNYHFALRQNGQLIPIKSYSREGDTFTITAGEYSKRDNLQLSYNYIFSYSKFNIKVTGGGTKVIKLGKFTDTKKPFSYPLSSLIGVTQWHGNTAFQKPHKGIDFGATKEKALAVYDGTVVSKGWDSYGGKCHSGGNYLVIKQKNGMYTAYFHLEKSTVNVGAKVKKGQKLGISGNSGAWNCQKLGYHLHFETRRNRSQSTHINPVNYINVDWNKVYTLGSSYNKGRLSGENPHPNY